MSRIIKLSLGARGTIFAPKGRCLVSLDFRSQELMIAAVQSLDNLMLQAFRVPETLVDELGIVYSNPDADLHTLTCLQLFPDIFIEPDGSKLPKSKWVERAKDESQTKLPGSPRDYGKFLAAA